MSAFLNSVKADLLDRRIAPLALAVVVALLGAIVYVVLSGSSAQAPTASSTPGAPVATPGIAVSQPATSKAVAETTDGTSEQSQGASRNPFAPLPSVAKLQAAQSATPPASSTSSPSSSSGSASSPSSALGSGTPSETTPAPESSTHVSEPKPAPKPKPSKPKTVYHVAAMFGVVPPETPVENVQLTPYENLKLFTPLPSAQLPLLAFRGVTADGKSATFTLVGEVILHGGATCLPSASQCQAIGLKAGQTEQLEYLPASGQPVTYELRIVSISVGAGSGASVKSLLGVSSKAGRKLLGREGLMALPGLRYSPRTGVLVFAGHSSFSAHAARRHSR